MKDHRPICAQVKSDLRPIVVVESPLLHALQGASNLKTLIVSRWLRRKDVNQQLGAGHYMW